MKRKVLIAHAETEENYAEQIAAPIQGAGYEVAYAGTVMVGESLIEEAVKVLNQGGPVVLCGTITAMGTSWPHRIINAARNNQCQGRVFCVRMQQKAYVEQLSLDECIAEYWQDPERAIQGLIASLKKHYPLRDNNNSPNVLDIRPLQHNNIENKGIRIEQFKGRDNDLEILDEKLKLHHKVVIVGLPGLGKTELAIQYGKRHLDTYKGGIFWSLEQDLVQNLDNFVFPDRNLEQDNQEKRIRYCWDKWTREGDILIIIDNFVFNKHTELNTPIDKLFLPNSSRFKVLITTRDHIANIESFEPDVLEPNDALSLLKFIVEDERQFRDEQENKSAKELCESLGRLPLALELVGQYVKDDSNIRISEILRESALNHPALEEAQPGMTAKLGVKAAFNLSWERLEEEVQQLGCLLSLFPLDFISWPLLTEIYRYWQRENLKDAVPRSFIIKLIKRSLLKPNSEKENYYILHPLIREFFQEQLKKLPQGNEIKLKFSKGMLEQAKQILNSSDFTNPNLKTILDCLLQKPSAGQDNNSLIEFLNLLFDRYYSSHQYLYDTAYLETAIDKLETLKEYLKPLDEPKAKVVIGKMLGHAYYNYPRRYGQQATDNMLMAAGEIAANVNRASNEESQIWKWYQIFLLDHVRNLLPKCDGIHLDLTYEDLETQISELLPDSLEQTTTPPQPDEWFFVLRAAHYWGHRGNQVGYELEKIVSTLSNEIETQTVESLYEQGICYYSLAAIFRSVSLRLSFPQQSQQSFTDLLQKVPYIPEWLKTWNPNLQDSDNSFERFASPSQAVGDIAHQYRGIAAIQLWSYPYYVFKGVTRSNLQLKLEDTRRIVEVCIELWEKADELRTPGEQIIKYYTWIANLTIMLDLAKKHCSGRSLPDLEEEVIPQVNQKLDKLEKDYGLVYEQAKKETINQVKKFYPTLSNLGQPR